jgi:uncharacterized membrane protein (DUF485 family)
MCQTRYTLTTTGEALTRPRFSWFKTITDHNRGLGVAHFDSKPATNVELETEASAARNARVGLVLFAIYLAFYAAFVILTAFAADWMQTQIAGVNIAIYSGFGLILGAFLLALVYLWLCRRPTQR